MIWAALLGKLLEKKANSQNNRTNQLASQQNPLDPNYNAQSNVQNANQGSVFGTIKEIYGSNK